MFQSKELASLYILSWLAVLFLVFFLKEPRSSKFPRKLARTITLLDAIFLLGYWALIHITVDRYSSVTERILSIVIIISTFLCIRFYLVISQFPRSRKSFYSGLVLMIIFIELSFGLFYYLIYRYDQLAYQFIATDLAHRKAILSKEVLESKYDLQKRLTGCRIVKDILGSKHAKISRQIGLNAIDYVVDGENEPLVTTHRFGITIPPAGTFFSYSVEINLDFVSFSRFFDPLNHYSTPRGMFKNEVRDIHIDSARTEIVTFLNDLEEDIIGEISELNSKLKTIDQEIKDLTYIDFILYSLNTSAFLGPGIIVPNSMMTKILSVMQVIVLLIVLLGLANLHGYRRKVAGNDSWVDNI